MARWPVAVAMAVAEQSRQRIDVQGNPVASASGAGTSRRLRGWRAAWAGLVLLACMQVASALEIHRQLSQFHHTAWSVKDGAPGQITALAQTADGYLWLATQIGLYRFDGVQFERYAPPAGESLPATSVSALYAPPEGGLWVGFRYGAVSHIHAGGLDHYGEAQGLPSGTVFGFARDADGRLWAATFTGLVYLERGRWHALGPEWKFPGRQARTVFNDASGTLWVATEQGAAFLPRGARAFQRVQAPVGRISQFSQAPDGGIWIAEADRAVRVLPLPGVPMSTAALPLPSAGLLFDRDGALWATTLGDGVYRLAGEGQPHFESYRQRDGLSSDYALPLLEDREGTIWVGSSRGLDRFRHANVVLARLPDGAHDFAIVAGDGAAVLAGSRNRPLMRLRDDTLETLSLPPPLTAAYRDDEGVVWLGGPKGLWTLRDGRLAPAAPLPVSAYSGVQAIARTTDGTLWVSLNTPGIHRLRDGHWTHLQELAGTRDGSSPLSLLADREGQLWMGFAHNRIARMREGSLQVFGPSKGLDVGNVSALHQGRSGIWIGGERGLARLRGDRIQSLRARADSPFRGISGIVETADGDLWLNGARGIVRVPASAIEAVLKDSPHAAYDLFDFLDGLPGVPAQFRPIPTALQAGNGKLWFATTSGVVSIDPKAIQRNPLPPPVAIRALSVDGRDHRLEGGPLSLPAGARNLQIGYTALSLAIPERVRFRYRLEGYEQEWQEAGTRRVAYYNDPGPGHYVFRVLAANNDGVWNETGASIAFSIAPRYYQTPWFALLCIALIAGLLWVAYLMRLRRVSRQIHDRLQERHRERERIARELHDTLLQSVQGLILRFHAVAGSLGASAPGRDALESVLERADDVLVEARDRVLDLRATHHAGGLSDVFVRMAADLASDADVSCRVTMEGLAVPLDPIVQDELVQIGREALVNAFRHAHAGHIEVVIEQATDGVRVRFIDDGRGIEPDVLARGGRHGHWGLAGMRERAERLGATLDVASRPGEGTCIDVRVPAALAYRARSRGWQRWLLGRRAGKDGR
jgi:signal transduction histidine kinase/ligand-binding sensor domain-containing protein